jgi:hypothetical protein
MNERIQKLIEQATSTQGPTPYNPLTFEVFDKEKFAELIVKECAGIYDKIDNGNLHMGTYDYLEALNKTFFGVEE